MKMGNTVLLRATRSTDNGLYFTDGEAEVLLPKSELSEGWVPGLETRLFLYRDSEDRPTATRRVPLAEVGQAAWLEVVDANTVGAFVDIGLRKHLLIPHSQQNSPLKTGQRALVMVLLDEETDRLYGTTLFSKHLLTNTAGFRLGQEVRCQVWRLHDKGWTVLVEHRWQGLIYRNETPRVLEPGETLNGWVYALREDGKIDVRLRPQGFTVANPDARERILQALNAAGGTLLLGDKSDPQEILATLGLSKKAFKVACGTLWKEKKILLEDRKITLSAT